MKVPRKFRILFLNFLKYYINPLTLKLARSSRGPFAIVKHVGRRSGKHYETPIIVGSDKDGFVIELTYGPDVDWYKNVVAANGCTLVVRGKKHVINHLEPLDVKTGRSAFPLIAQLLLRISNKKHFVRMTKEKKV